MDSLGYCANVLRCRSAAAADNVKIAIQSHFLYCCGHFRRLFIIFAHLVREPGVRITNQRTFSPCRCFCNQWSKIFGAKRAVQPECHKACV